MIQVSCNLRGLESTLVSAMFFDTKIRVLRQQYTIPFMLNCGVSLFSALMPTCGLDRGTHKSALRFVLMVGSKCVYARAGLSPQRCPIDTRSTRSVGLTLFFRERSPPSAICVVTSNLHPSPFVSSRSLRGSLRKCCTNSIQRQCDPLSSS